MRKQNFPRFVWFFTQFFHFSSFKWNPRRVFSVNEFYWRLTFGFLKAFLHGHGHFLPIFLPISFWRLGNERRGERERGGREGERGERENRNSQRILFPRESQNVIIDFAIDSSILSVRFTIIFYEHWTFVHELALWATRKNEFCSSHFIAIWKTLWYLFCSVFF